MPNQKLGITATELFACNPYRILGVPVDAPTSVINETYRKLLSNAVNGDFEKYSTDFDFPSLPPFTRDEKSIKTAYGKLASNGYRCFAYSDGIFSAALNIDDVMLNLMEITCYDCFIRCYMWLVTNDREFEEPELWVPLCLYIDKMIMSSPEEWERYFDHRFPDDMYKDKMTALRSFYTTFCDIILLPIKEMVRGSMKCRTATDILRVAKVDVDEEFPFIEIPQANPPKKGEEAPKLKIAVKDGEEYFDIKTGKMVNFESDSESEVESNEFAAAASAISADVINSDEVPAEDIIPDEPENGATVFDSPAFSKPVAPAPVPVAEVPVEESPELKNTDEIVLPSKRHKVIIPGRAKAGEAPTTPKITPTIITPPVEKPISELLSNMDDDIDEDDVVTADVVAVPKTVPVSKAFTAPTVAAVTQENHTALIPKSKKPYKRVTKGLTSLIGEDESMHSDTSDIVLTDDADEEENLYTDTLIKMLRANRSNNQLMKDVDTRHVFNNGDSLGQMETPELAMDAINMKKLDKSLLSSPFENAKSSQSSDPKKARDEKYRNININDMLNPTMGNKLNGEFHEDAIEQYKKQKQQQKSFYGGLWKFIGVGTLVILILLFLFYFGVL